MKKETGQSLVEFALVLPLLILLLFGIVDFGRVFHAYLTIDHVGREAARAVSIGINDDIAKSTAVSNGASIGLTTTNVDITRESVTVSDQTFTNVEVTINYPVNFLTPVIGNLIGPLQLEDITTMRVE